MPPIRSTKRSATRSTPNNYIQKQPSAPKVKRYTNASEVTEEEVDAIWGGLSTEVKDWATRNTSLDKKGRWVDIRKSCVYDGGVENCIQRLERFFKCMMYPAEQLGATCPRAGQEVEHIEFDNIRVYFHPSYYEVESSPIKSWRFYIGRKGCTPDQCIAWKNPKEGIRVCAQNIRKKWGDLQSLDVSPGSRVRIIYRYNSIMRKRDIIFPCPGDDAPLTVIRSKWA